MYWIYQNYPTNKITVHSSNCSECNNGKGKHNRKSTTNGKWLGHYAGLKVALKNAEKHAQKSNSTYRLCSKCIGNVKAISKPQPLRRENLICNFKGVYKIYCYKKKPIEIGRVIKIDKQGLLYIGESSNAKGITNRLENLLTNINNANSNFHTAGYKIANRSSLNKYLKNKVLYFTCYESANPKADEKVELDSYIKIFGETPPLNQ